MQCCTLIAIKKGFLIWREEYLGCQSNPLVCHKGYLHATEQPCEIGTMEKQLVFLYISSSMPDFIQLCDNNSVYTDSDLWQCNCVLWWIIPCDNCYVLRELYSCDDLNTLIVKFCCTDQIDQFVLCSDSWTIFVNFMVLLHLCSDSLTISGEVYGSFLC